MTMLELIARKGNMSELVMPVPNSPLAEGADAFALNGLKGWALDGLEQVGAHLVPLHACELLCVSPHRCCQTLACGGVGSYWCFR